MSEQQSIIQKARDVLAKRRKASRGAGPQNRFWFTADVDPAVKNLFMLTTDPELLDALDYMMAMEIDHQLTSFSPVMRDLHVERIAAAIIAADESMSA